MSERIEIPQGGGQAVHVFALGLEGDEATRFVARPAGNGGGWPLQQALGAERLEPEGIEHFDASDLAGVGLSGYLTEGMGAIPDAVAADRARLDALSGEVVILRPAAFDGTAQTLTVAAPLTHLGSYPMAQPPGTMERIYTPSAEGTAVPGAPTTAPPTSRALKWLAAAAASVIVVGLLIALTGGFR